ncbi:MAG TPA: DEAD/DEAH box helicase, partial [Polyangia bacterium]|nr:DEAD/DEAH box helicase [Polyangia bacterium]
MSRTYGTAVYCAPERCWEIQAEPHVMIKLRRWFPGIKARDVGRVRLADTIENCRDLSWFVDRYPLNVDPLARLVDRASEHQMRMAFVADVLGGKKQFEGFELALPARAYQKEVAALALATGGLLCADEVGLGKTAASICMLTDPRTRPALVVTMTHLPTQWKREIGKFAPHLRAHIIQSMRPYDIAANPCRGKGGNKRAERHSVARFPDGTRRCARCGATGADTDPGIPDVIITSYHKLHPWAETLAPLVNSVIYDEVHELRRQQAEKDVQTKKYAGAAYISGNVDFRLGLSATPIFNYGGEIYNVMECISPGALGSREEFSTAWVGYQTLDDKARIANPAAFGAWMREAGWMLRRTRKDVGRELPPVSVIPEYIDVDEAVLRDAKSDACELARKIMSRSTSWNTKGEAAREFDVMMRHRTAVAKAPYVAEFVRMLVENGERVLLFGWHHDAYRIICERLAEFSPVVYTGKQSMQEKEAAKQRFIDGESSVFVMSLRSGAGLDGLQHVCKTVVFGELDWSP